MKRLISAAKHDYQMEFLRLAVQTDGKWFYAVLTAQEEYHFTILIAAGW